MVILKTVSTKHSMNCSAQVTWQVISHMAHFCHPFFLLHIDILSIFFLDSCQFQPHTLHCSPCRVVYSIPCMDCNSVYVGETGRNLEKRLKKH